VGVNISFVMPTKALLQTYFLHQTNELYTTDFPSFALIPFNYTGTPPSNTMVIDGTKVVLLPFNTSVHLVMQGMSILGAKNHPLHLHGFNFFVVGQGFVTSILRKTLLGSTWLIQLRETQLVHLQEGGLPLASSMITWVCLTTYTCQRHKEND